MRAALGVAGFAGGDDAMERGADGRSSLPVGVAGISWWLRSKELGLGRWLDGYVDRGRRLRVRVGGRKLG